MSVRALLSAGALITAGMLAGRLLGLLREMLLAAQFGIGHEADLAVALLLLPDFVTNLFIGSAASAALIPALAARDEERAQALLWQALAVSLAAFSVLALVLLVCVPFTPKPAFFLTILSLPLTAATAIITAWLQYRGRFLVPAFANAIFNSMILLALWLFPQGLVWLATGIAAGALLRLGTHALAFRRSGSVRPPRLTPWEVRAPLLRAYAATAGTGIFTLLPHYAPYATIALAAGSVAAFNYAFKLMLLPAILGQTVVQMALLPFLVRLRKNADAEAMKTSYGMALQCGWIFSFVACLSLSLVAEPLAEVCFGHGKMTADGIARVATLFTVGVWAMPPMVLAAVWQQILYASERTLAPLAASAAQALCVAPLCWAGQTLFGTQGVVFAFVLVQILPVVLLARHGYKSGLGRACWPSTACLAMTLASLAAFLPLAGVVMQLDLPPIAAVLAAGVVGLAALLVGFAASPPVRQWVRNMRRA